MHRYVDLSPLFESIAAHYVLLSWVHDAFAEMPYLRLRGDYGTGKTRGLIAIGSLCYRPFFAAGASTVSPIFHTLDRFGGTLVLNEADFRFSDATTDLVKIFNNGTVRGLPVLRTITDRNKEFSPAAFKVFGPKIVAMRGSFSDPALESRFITEETGNRELRTDIPIQTPDALHVEALRLRNRLLHFRLCTLFSTRPDPTLVATDIEPRLRQVALPLLSVIDDASLRSELLKMFRRQQSRTIFERQQTLQGRVVVALSQAFENAQTPSIPVQTITASFNELYSGEYGAPLSPRRIGGILRSLHIERHKSHGIFAVPITEKAKVEALSKRYGVEPRSAA